MKYFLDTEFLEGTQKSFFGKTTKPTIDLISIGIVAEDGREYYAISKDFNLKEAWNRYDLNYGSGDQRNLPPRKVYWIRENVLKPIFIELYEKSVFEYLGETDVVFYGENLTKFNRNVDLLFSYKKLKELIKKYGKSNSQIAKEVVSFCKPNEAKALSAGIDAIIGNIDLSIEFYGYFSDYDWVVFCWLFGRMMDLPDGFPMYCNDLKQTLDELQLIQDNNYKHLGSNSPKLKQHVGYPKQIGEHNALSDAKWNFELYKFLESLK